jgi:hypothetical protein
LRIHVEYPYSTNCEKYEKFYHNKEKNEICVWINCNELNSILIKSDLPANLNSFIGHKYDKDSEENKDDVDDEESQEDID